MPLEDQPQAYKGTDPYIFVSYAHHDAEAVFPIINRFQQAGVNVWFDEGINPGARWREELAAAIENCAGFVFFLSQGSANSSVCWTELNFALDEHIPFLTLQLEKFPLPTAMRFAIADRQSIFLYGAIEAEQKALSWLKDLVPADGRSGRVVQTTVKTPQELAEKHYFVGREFELNWLASRFKRWRKSLASDVLVIDGEPGVGKSALVEAFLSRGLGNLLVLRASSFSGGSEPYNAWQGVIDELAAALMASETMALSIPRNSESLACLFPAFSGISPKFLPMQESTQTDDPAELKRMAFVKLRDLLDRLSENTPIVVWFDNFESADVESRQLLEALSSGPAPPPVMWIVNQSTDAPTVSTTQEQLTVSVLNEIDALAVARSLARDKDVKNEALLLDIVGCAAGLPFLIELGLRALDEAQFFDAADPYAGVIGALAPKSKNVLNVIALANQATEIRFLEQMMREDIGDAIEALVKNRLIKWTKGKDAVQIYHVSARNHLVSAMSFEDKRAIHLLIAGGLEQRDTKDFFALHWHFEQAGEPKPALKYLLLAADRADNQLAFKWAIELYRKALKQGDDQSFKLHPKLARSLANDGKTAEAAERLLVASALAVDVGKQSKHLELAAYYFLLSGRFAEGIQVYRPRLRNYGVNFPGTQNRALKWVFRCVAFLNKRGLNYDECSESEADPKVLSILDTCDQLARGFLVVDTARGVYFAMVTLLHALRCGEPRRLLRAIDLADSTGLLTHANASIFSNATRLIDTERVLAKDRGDFHFLARSFANAAQKSLLQGLWEDAKKNCDVSLRANRQAGQPLRWEANVSTMTQLRALEELGELEQMHHTALDLAEAAAANGDFYGVATGRLNAGFGYLAKNEPEMARSIANQVNSMWSGIDFHMQHFYIKRLEIFCDLYEYDLESASHKFLEFAPRIESSGFLSVPMVCIDFALLAARVELAQARAQNRQADCTNQLHALNKQKRRDTRSHVSLIKAGISAVSGDRDSAAEQLRLAVAGFSELNMAMYKCYANARLVELSVRDTSMPPRQMGNALAKALAPMLEQKIARPDFWLDLQLPGFSTDHAEQRSVLPADLAPSP